MAERSRSQSTDWSTISGADGQPNRDAQTSRWSLAIDAKDPWRDLSDIKL
jgi:hypothetical protein